MRNERPDGRNLRTLLEAALAPSLGSPAPAGGVPEPVVPASSGSPVVVGEVVDTHHPHLPGRVLVRWSTRPEGERTEWLHHERHLTLGRGDRVLVTLPLGWAEWLVTGALGRATTAPSSGIDEGTPAPSPHAVDPAPRRDPALRLEPGQSLRIIGDDGQPLLTVHPTGDGLRLELARDQIEIKARRRLRLSADSIEIAAGPGGVDVRTEGDAVIRARAIRLN